MGLLALPYMRYFSEADESVQFQTVITGILQEYCRCIQVMGTGANSPKEILQSHKYTSDDIAFHSLYIGIL